MKVAKKIKEIVKAEFKWQKEMMWKGFNMLKNEEGVVTKQDLLDKLPEVMEAHEKAQEERYKKMEAEMMAEMEE